MSDAQTYQESVLEVRDFGTEFDEPRCVTSTPVVRQHSNCAETHAVGKMPMPTSQLCSGLLSMHVPRLWGARDCLIYSQSFSTLISGLVVDLWSIARYAMIWTDISDQT